MLMRDAPVAGAVGAAEGSLEGAPRDESALRELLTAALSRRKSTVVALRFRECVCVIIIELLLRIQGADGDPLATSLHRDALWEKLTGKRLRESKFNTARRKLAAIAASLDETLLRRYGLAAVLSTLPLKALSPLNTLLSCKGHCGRARLLAQIARAEVIVPVRVPSTADTVMYDVSLGDISRSWLRVQRRVRGNAGAVPR